jgi:hypothetical protein
LKATLERLVRAQPGLQVVPIPTRLEHAFIYLMGRVRENEAAPPHARASR